MKKDDKKATKHCGACKNFDPGKKGGWCRNRNERRSADDKACGDFKKR